MLISSMNSLAEVGVGINLAYGMIRSLREVFLTSFEDKLNRQRDKIQLILSETGSKNGGVSSSIAIKVDDIRQRYLSLCQSITNIMVVLAMLSAASLFWFLCESAADSNRDVVGQYVYLAVACAAGPLVFAAVLQTMLYGAATLYLRLRMMRYENYANVVREAERAVDPIQPTP